MRRFGLLLLVAVLSGCVAPPGPPILDSDGDGVPNSSDACPNDPGPASNSGCPLEPEPPGPAPKDVAQFPELLLRQSRPGWLDRAGEPFFPSGAVQCCMATVVSVYDELAPQKPRLRRPRPLRVSLGPVAAYGTEINSRWPSIGVDAMRFFHEQGGANFFEFRILPYRGDADHESEWADVGGPYLPGQWPNRNRAWWDLNREAVHYAGTIGANVKIIFDAWYGKACKLGWQPCDWPQSAIQSFGEVFTTDHQLLIDHIVEEFGCSMNVAWGVDNEGALVPRAKREFYEKVAWAFRDAEQRFACRFPDGSTRPVVHMVWTNWPEIGDGPFDAVSTHDDAPLTRSFFGKHSDNNERNGTRYSAQEDHARFCQARTFGGHYWFWRADDPDALMREKLALRKQGCAGGAQACFVPGANDPNWDPDPSGGGSPVLRAGIESAELQVGERCGASDKYAALGLLAEELRARGYCAAGPWGDALAVRCANGEECVQEHHSVRFTDGCWSVNPDVLPKNTWRYKQPLPRRTYPDVGPVDEILCKLHGAERHIYDCTPKRGGQKVAEEDDPERRFKELFAMGDADPAFTLEVQSGSLELVPQPNPMQFQIKGAGSGVVRCTVPATGSQRLCNAAVSR